MNIQLVMIGSRLSASKRTPGNDWFNTYLARINHYSDLQQKAFPTEEAFLSATQRVSGRTAPSTILLDSRGKQFSSEQFAAYLGKLQDQGTQQVIFAVGPADGWSEAARQSASLLLSLGPMTLPHELARVVLAEQIYRAFTILSGHPYHSGH
ncbi:MAG: 23S rRNA (pseudouridine(1915)-N(3))-methyltransferase RlmH [Acidobacteriaceae bacterium]